MVPDETSFGECPRGRNRERLGAQRGKIEQREDVLAVRFDGDRQPVAIFADGERLDVLRRRVDGPAGSSQDDHRVDTHRRPIGIRQHVHRPSVRREPRLAESGRLFGRDQDVAARGGDVDDHHRLRRLAMDECEDRAAVGRRRSDREQTRESFRERKRPCGRLRPGCRRRRRYFGGFLRIDGEHTQRHGGAVLDRVEELLPVAREAAQELISGIGIDGDRWRTLFLEEDQPPASVSQRHHDQPSRLGRQVTDFDDALRLVRELGRIAAFELDGGGLAGAEQRGEERDAGRIRRRRGRPGGRRRFEVPQSRLQVFGGRGEQQCGKEH